MAALLINALAFTTLGIAGGLKSFTWTVESQFQSPDCVDKLVATINGQMPGPILRVPPNEDVAITVVNHMPDKGLAIHWHGQEQMGTPWQDGTWITNCPTPPMSSYTYRFKVNDKPGTYMYHGHIGGLRSAGLSGVLIIDGDISAYATSLAGDHVVHIQDWYHAPDSTLIAGLLSPAFRWAGDPQSLLINGKGSYNCTGGEGAWYDSREYCHRSMCPAMETFHVTAGQSYLFRFVNSAALSLINIAIEGHTMTVVEADGHPTQPFSSLSVDVNSGMRISAKVTANRAPGVYVMRAKIRARSGVRFAHALVQYAGHSTQLSPEEAMSRSVMQPEWNDNEFTFSFQNSFIGLYTGATAVPAVPPTENVTKRFELLGTQERIAPGTSSNGVPSIDNIQTAVGTGSDRPENNCDSNGNTRELRWLIGRRTWRYPDTPVLSMLYLGLGQDVIAEERMYHELELGSTYDVVLQNYPACSGVCETHSWHFHGTHFWVLGTGRGEWTGSSAQMAALNLVDPPYRDTVQTVSEGADDRPATRGPCGYTYLRMKPQSPGAWLAHCHQLWHVPMGMDMLFYTKARTIPAPPEDLLLCGRMTVDRVHAKLMEGLSTTASTTEDASIVNGVGRRDTSGFSTMAVVIAVCAIILATL